ncbi:MAG: exodeoxyribonuclease VII small subunit [Erysipelotrichaceae bacterium]|jgi:exodeoxyribonuclease VII small subunit|nr:exodeoxyribonuclease VII small subunit [Bacilli bacterium]NLV28762.1 exodeoxyribonuclease VII small subunit [Erysipelotrichaceae bacterium]HPY79449.1 exodeoxyribonuclease VII small subunit [Bacilli bacterium]HQA55517.1 exodeoxyribonuclease VII small subunit [Bacilli bacterium]
MKETPIKFEEELKRLDEIVSKISSKTLPLEESLKLYQEGQEIIVKLSKLLKEAEEKVEKVVDIK